MVAGCALALQGFEPCGNLVEVDGRRELPCRAGLRVRGGVVERLIYDIVLSRPEDYLSIYQSCCNHDCAMCHSWYFSQRAVGRWMKPEDILAEVLKYREQVTVWEPRHRATMWHASDLCAHCGYCLYGLGKGPYCPGRLKPSQVLVSPQGFGPARNIVSFTGGDLYCQPRFYVETFKLIKREVPDMWIHIETNGYGLTPRNLEQLYEAGLDSVWLDMKAYREDVYRSLCGTTNKWILELPARIKDMGIVLEIVLLYIPGYVEQEDMEGFAKLIADVDPYTPVMLLAFFPEYKLTSARPPTLEEMLRAYQTLVEGGLKRIKIGNVGVFCRDRSCVDKLIKAVGRENVAL